MNNYNIYGDTMAIDPTTDIGLLRLRVGDVGDLEIFPDTVYQSALDGNDGDINRAAQLCAQYILARLSFSGHERLAVIEVYGNQIFDQYLQFLKLTVLNPNFSQTSPIPYSASTTTHPLIQFEKDFQDNYIDGKQSDEMNLTAYFGTTNKFF